MAFHTEFGYIMPHSPLYLSLCFRYPPVLHRLVLDDAPTQRHDTLHPFIGFNSSNAYPDSVRGFGCYRHAQLQLLVILLFTDLASINILATCVSKQVPFMLPIIAADVCLVPYVCGCMLVHHMSFIAFPRQYFGPSYLWPDVVLEQLLYNRRQQETDWEEWGSQATTLFCDDEYDEQIDHDSDLEPLLQEWLAEQQRLNQMEDEDADNGTEPTITESSIVNLEMDF